MLRATVNTYYKYAMNFEAIPLSAAFLANTVFFVPPLGTACILKRA